MQRLRRYLKSGQQALTKHQVMVEGFSVRDGFGQGTLLRCSSEGLESGTEASKASRDLEVVLEQLNVSYRGGDLKL